MRLFYKPIKVVHENKLYTATVSTQASVRLLLTVTKKERHLFIFDNWDGEGPGVLIIYKNGKVWDIDEASAIKDIALAQSAGKSIENLL